MAGASPISGAERTEGRIAILTLLLGAGAALLLAWKVSLAWGAGTAVGAGLAWLNFRWMRQGVNALARAAEGQHEESSEPRPARIPLSVGARFVGRYALIAGVLYAIVVFYRVPILSLLTGLFSLGAAAIVAALYEALATR